MKKFLLGYITVSILAISCKKNEDAEKSRIIHVPDDISSIQEAINKADDLDTILVSTGIYEENINFNGKEVYLTSVYYRTLDTLDIKNTIIKGKSGSVVTFENNEDSSSVINGFTITNGKPLYDNNSGTPIHWLGGGIYIKKSNPSLSNLIIENNKMYFPMEQGKGGGIYCEDGGLKGINLILRNNICGGVSGGGAIYGNNSKIHLQSCKIYNNRTLLIEFCGGLYFYKVNFTIKDSKIEKNYSIKLENENLFVESTGFLVNSTINDTFYP